MHLVGFALKPGEIAFHAIPAAGLPSLAVVDALFSLDKPLLGGGGEFFKWTVKVDPTLARMAQQVVLTLRRLTALKWANDSLRNRERLVRHDALHVDANDASKPLAVRACPERAVEAEEGRGRWANIQVARRAMPTGGISFAASSI